MNESIKQMEPTEEEKAVQRFIITCFEEYLADNRYTDAPQQSIELFRTALEMYPERHRKFAYTQRLLDFAAGMAAGYEHGERIFALFADKG